MDPSAGAKNKLRVDINVTAETKRQLDGIVTSERENDRRSDRPERSKSAILEMILKKGIRVWENSACATCLKKPLNR